MWSDLVTKLLWESYAYTDLFMADVYYWHKCVHALCVYDCLLTAVITTNQTVHVHVLIELK